MDKKQDGKPRSNYSSRLNKRIQVLEEHLANTNREVRKLNELVGSRADTNELFSLVGQLVEVRDVTDDERSGVLRKVGKWTVTIEIEHVGEIIYFKGNLVYIRRLR